MNSRGHLWYIVYQNWRNLCEPSEQHWVQEEFTEMGEFFSP